MMSLWDALRMNMMISYQELVRTFLSISGAVFLSASSKRSTYGSQSIFGVMFLYCHSRVV
ncbi:hypothetical protein AM452_11495 [Enterobacter cloacae]|nr:hypothetical protein AM452_11495 [Enterobacter cloacae]